MKKLMVISLLFMFSISVNLVSAQTSFSFAAAGDIGINGNSNTMLNNLASSGINFYLALGDMDYDQSYTDSLGRSYNGNTDSDFCRFVTDRIGSTYPFQLISGNHEQDGGVDGYIGNHAQCLPDRLGGIPSNLDCSGITGSIPPSCYAREYYFDYPSSSPIMRVILLATNLPVGGRIWSYPGSNCDTATDSHTLWVCDKIRTAKAAGMWVVVGMHKVCLEATGDKSCEGQDLTNMLISEKVDLVLQGHAHTYQRSKQLTLSASCSTVSSSSYNSNCVVDDGTDNMFTKGAGTVFVIQGIGGVGIRPMGSGSEPDLQYFYKIMGSDGCRPSGISCPSNKFGFMKYTVSSERIDVQTVLNGGLSFDSFSIVGGPPPSDFSVSINPPKITFNRNPVTPLVLGHTEPDVIRVGNTFYLYYRTDSSIGVATSMDGLNWIDQGIILSKSGSGWDSAEVIAPSVILDNGIYFLFYEADDASRIGNRAIGVATSTSPTGPFMKYSGNPVLKSTSSWEGTIVGTPVITKVASKYYLFYHGFSNGNDRIGVAYSDDLFSWTKESNNPILDIGASGTWDDAKVAPSTVYVNGSQVIVFYEGFDGTNELTQTSWRIGIADGNVDPVDSRIKSLTRYSAPALDLGAANTWDDNTVQLPSIIQVGTELWLYYSGHDGTAFRLGRAIASQPLQVSFVPSIGTFYYPWYGNSTTGWRHWRDPGANGNTHNPSNTWYANYLPDKDPSQFSPSTELYDSNDYSTISWQLSLMRKAGIQFVILSWWGKGDGTNNPIAPYEDNAFKKILFDYMKRSDNPYPGLLWAIYYEKEGFRNPTEAEITNDLQYITNTYCSDPNYFKIDGKCVIFVYGSTETSEMVTRWSNVRNSLGNVYIVLKVFSGYGSYATQVDGWHQYAPSAGYGEHLPYSAFASPGFWKPDDTAAPFLARDLAAFDTRVSQLKNSNARFKLIETWNEIPEGSQVEPAQEIVHNDAGIFTAAKPSYGTSFIDVIAKYFGSISLSKFFGTIKDYNNNPIVTDLSFYQQSNLVSSITTDSSGNYILSINPGVYDVQYSPRTFYISNYYLKVLSINISGDILDMLNRISEDSTNNKISFSLNLTGSNTVQSYSPNKPSRVLKDGQILAEVSSLASLTSNTWYYDTTNKILHVRFAA